MIALAALLATQSYVAFIGDPALPTTRLSYSLKEDRLETPKLSPKKFGDPAQPFQFDWLVEGGGKPRDKFEPRFRVYSQERKSNGDKALLVLREMLRLWDYTYQKLNYDHSDLYDNRIVTVYLCWGGTPGGEQLFDEEVRDAGGTKVPVKVNTVYIYDLASFKDPVEMAREVAHEYGHAILPPVGGFKEPEDWGNGFLGEKLFMRYLRNDLRAKKLEPIDAMGCTADQLDGWVKQNVDPLEKKIATNGPEVNLIAGQGQGAMNEYIGLTLLMQTILPPKVFNATLRDSASTQAKDYPDAILRTVQTWPTGVVLDVPAEYRKPKSGIWVPLGKCSIAGATVMRKKGDWAFVQPGVGVVTLVPPKK